MQSYISIYIDSSLIEDYISQGWTVFPCRYYGRDKQAYIAMREADEINSTTRQEEKHSNRSGL